MTTLTPEQLAARVQARRRRAAWDEKSAHEKRMTESNPACRFTGEKDRPEDIAFNEACRRYEKTHNYADDRS